MSEKLCPWCNKPITGRGDKRYCCNACRQAAFKARSIASLAAAEDAPKVLAYADPPYPGCAKKYYGCDEVDHARLLDHLQSGIYDGWALSTSVNRPHELFKIMSHINDLEAVRLCAWSKPIGVCPNTHHLHNLWEILIVHPARHLLPAVGDTLIAQPARKNGTLPGRKPVAFAQWLYKCLGARAGDTLHDLFPGTGIITRTWVIAGGIPGKNAWEGPQQPGANYTLATPA